MKLLVEYIYSLHNVFCVPLLSLLGICSIICSLIITDEYLLRYLSQITQSLMLRSETVAILLINLGNGLPELISSILLVQDSQNIHYALYSAAGAQVTILTLVLACTIFASPRLVFLNGRSFYKNIFFLVLSTFALFIPFFTYEISKLLAIFMIGSYCAFLFYSVGTKAQDQQIETIDETVRMSKLKKFTKKVLKPIHFFFNIAICEKTLMFPYKVSCFISLFINIISFLLINWHHFLDLNDYFISKAMNRTLFGLTAPQISLLVISLSLAGIFLSIYVILTFTRHFSNKPHLIYNIAMSILWIFFPSQLIIEIFTHLPSNKALIALIILPLGNSFGDVITNSIAAQKGMIKVGLTASLTSPIHNVLLNMGLTLLFMEFINTNEFDSSQEQSGFLSSIFTKQRIQFSALLFMIPLTISLTVIFILCFNFEIRNRKLARECGAVLFTVYGLYFFITVGQIFWGNGNESTDIWRR